MQTFLRVLRKTGKIILWFLAVVIALSVLALIFSGRIAKKYLEKHDKDLIGREITVDRIVINPLLGTIKIKDFVLYEKDGKTPFLKFERLRYKMNPLALLNKKVKVNKIELSKPFVRLIQVGKVFNIDDIIARLTSSGEKSSTPWIIDLNNIDILSGMVLYRDLQVGSKFGLHNVTVSVPRVYFSGKDTDAGINLNFEDGGSLGVALSYNAENSNYNLKLNLKNFAAQQILPYLQQYMNISQTKGALNLALNISGEINHLLDATIDGAAFYTNGQVLDNNGNEVFAVDSVRATVKNLNVQEKNALLESLDVFGPRASYTINKDKSTNFEGLFKGEEEIQQEKDAVPEPPEKSYDEEFLKEVGLVEDSLTIKENANKDFYFHIDKLNIQGGDVTYTDHTLPKIFTYHLSEISTLCEDFALNKMNRIKGAAVLGKSGKVSLDWVTDFKSMRNMDLVLILNNLSIKDFTPYSHYYVGNDIEGGILRLLSHNTVTENKLKGDNRLEIYKPRVSKRINKNPVYKLPVRLGVYVLTDRKDNMKVSLPVSGDLDNPKFSYIKLLFRALGNLLIKVSTAPFIAIGDLISPDSEDDIGFISLDSRAPDFSPEQYARLEQFTDWIKEKKELKFEFIQRVNLENIIALRDAAAQQKHDSLHVFTEEKMLQLARLRNDNLKNYLVRMGVSPERFTIAPIVLDSLKNYKGKDKFSIVSSMEGDDEDYSALED